MFMSCVRFQILRHGKAWKRNSSRCKCVRAALRLNLHAQIALYDILIKAGGSFHIINSF